MDALDQLQAVAKVQTDKTRWGTRICGRETTHSHLQLYLLYVNGPPGLSATSWLGHASLAALVDCSTNGESA